MAPSCPICFTAPLKQPRALVCGHTFCSQCVAQWHAAQESAGRDNLTCPVCRTHTGKPERPPSAGHISHALPRMHAEDRSTSLARAATSRANRLRTDYPRVSIRAQLESEHSQRTAAYERRRELSQRLDQYRSNLVSPISGRPLEELESIHVADFDRVFGRAAARRAIFGDIGISQSSALHA